MPEPDEPGPHQAPPDWRTVAIVVACLTFGGVLIGLGRADAATATGFIVPVLAVLGFTSRQRNR